MAKHEGADFHGGTTTIGITEEQARAVLERIAKETFINTLKNKYNEDKWEISFVSDNLKGYIVTDKSRIGKGVINKQEKGVFEKEMRACKVLANNGYKIEYLTDTNRAKKRTYDITMNGLRADLKCVTGGSSNITKRVRRAVIEQGAEVVVFEIPVNKIEYRKAMYEAKRKYKTRIMYYYKEEKILYELN